MEEADKKAKSLGAVMKVDTEDGKVAYFRAPNRYVIGFFYAKLKDNYVAAIESLFKGTIISEVSTINLDDDSDFVSIMEHNSKLIQLVENQKKSSTSTLL